MTRLVALSSCFALGLLCLVPACETSSGDESASEGESGSNDTTGDGDGDTTDTDGPAECGTEWAEKDGMTESIMDEWGAPCMQDSDCTPILGDGAVCVTNILGVYDLPGGFCTKYCELPDSMTSFLHDAPDCDPNGGVTCVGANGLFTACIIPCENHSQCGREGYGCRTMPTLAAEGDPTFCLMSSTDCCTTDSGECAP
jgi:hypothetical protein